MKKKYRQIFLIQWSNGFVYRLNFIMWRVRMVLQMLSVYFLWLAVLRSNPEPFGYSASTLLTYVLGTSLIRAVVFSSQSIGLQRDIGTGDLSNFLIKPINIFGYWFSRDWADKSLNSAFAVLEISVIYLLLKPTLVLPVSLSMGILFLFFVVAAALIYFLFSLLISLTVFWMPEGNGWPQRFLIFTLLEFLSGGLFPLDILPKTLYTVIGHLPTAYMLNIPMQIYLGRIPVSALPSVMFELLFWLILMYVSARLLFRAGLKVYGAYGR